MRHLYIENPREHALEQIDPYGRRMGFDAGVRSVLRDCIDEAWDDGHAHVTLATVAIKTGVSEQAAREALHELTRRGVIEMQTSSAGRLVVRPLVLASGIGTQAGVGWWQRLELQDEL
jgi:hypothetical protein